MQAILPLVLAVDGQRVALVVGAELAHSCWMPLRNGLLG